MTSNAVSDVKSFFLNTASNANTGKDAVGKDTFSQVFDKATDSQPGKQNSIQDSKNVNRQPVIQKKTSTKGIEDTTTVDGNKNQDAVSFQEKESAIEDTAKAIIKEVADGMDLDEEEVALALEEMGLVPMDLLQPATLQQFMVEMTPEADALSLMTNEQLFSQVKALTESLQGLGQDLSQTLQVAPEDLMSAVEDILASAEAVLPETEIDLTLESIADTEKKLAAVEVKTEIAPQNISGKPLVEVIVEAPKESSVEKESTIGAEKQEVVVETPVESDMEPKTQTFQAQTGQQEEHHEEKDTHLKQTSFSQQILDQLTQNLEEISTESTMGTTSSSRIMEQITEYIRVQARPELTEMELQLHPASLGNIKVQVASHNGVITANFTTQNEEVKAAVENQLVQLKEELNKQGIEVQAVEVTVESHAFDENLSQQGEDRNQSEQSGKAKGTRRIQLGNLEEEEEMAPEEEILADMMARNGNSIDYTV